MMSLDDVLVAFFSLNDVPEQRAAWEQAAAIVVAFEQVQADGVSGVLNSHPELRYVSP